MSADSWNQRQCFIIRVLKKQDQDNPEALALSSRAQLVVIVSPGDGRIEMETKFSQKYKGRN